MSFRILRSEISFKREFVSQTKKMNLLVIKIVLMVEIVSNVNALPQYQQQIPNGAIVPNPCNRSVIWPGVGHQNSAGGGPRNPFGLDFAANNHVWTSTLCQSDSDGDGLTNGQELGDPGCTWTEGGTPTRNTNLTHPGICEPLNSDNCMSRNSWLNCGGATLNCPAIDNDPNVKNYTIRIPVTTIPSEDTTYICQKFQLPSGSQNDIIAIKPFIDNAEIVHHMLLFGCTGYPGSHPVNESYFCSMGGDPTCLPIINVWTVGFAGDCYSNEYGFRMGPGGYQYAVLQIHWNNPLLKANLTDSSGLTLFYTSQLRPNRGGVHMVGQQNLVIPPGLPEVVLSGSCAPACTNQFNGTIFLTSAFLHMHLLGTSGTIALYRNGVLLQMLENVTEYDYDMPLSVKFNPPIQMMPGDEIRTRCVYQSLQRNTTTYFGLSTFDEMCYAFIIYYPFQPGFDFCGQWKTIDFCNFEGNIQFPLCDFPTFLQLAFYLNSTSCSIDCSAAPCGAIMNKVYATGCLNFADPRDFLRQYTRVVQVLMSCMYVQPMSPACGVTANQPNSTPVTGVNNNPTTPTGGNKSTCHTASCSISILSLIFALINYR